MQRGDELVVWGASDWGVASTDPECLSVLAYMQFVNVKYSSASPLKHVDVTESGARRDLFFRHGHDIHLPRLYAKRKSDAGEADEAIVSGPEIVAHFRLHCNLDYQLKEVNWAEIVAFEAMLEECVHPALQHYTWIHEHTLKEFHTTYGSILPVPYNYITPRWFRRRAANACKGKGEEELLRSASECIQVLADRLAAQPDTTYFLGDEPTYLDAVVFGYVAVILHAPGQFFPLRSLIDEHPGLLKWCEHVEKTYFAEVLSKQAKLREDKEPFMAQVLNMSEDTKRTLKAGAVATAAMSLFAFTFLLGRVRLFRS